MDKRYIAAGVVLVVGIAGAVWWTRGAGKRQLANCAALESQRALLAVSGANTDELARLDIAIETCKAQAEALGESVDSGASVLAGCEIKRKAIVSEFNAYKATATEDAIQRNNKRQNMLHLGTELVTCYGEATRLAETVATIDAVRRSIDQAIRESRERSACWRNGETGCSRYGVNESSGDERDTDEARGTWIPLKAALATAVMKRDELVRAEREAARDAAAMRNQNRMMA